MCPIDARLAAAVSGEDADALAHARECLRCRALVIEQRQVIADARRGMSWVLSTDRRAALAAEVMARSDMTPNASQSRSFALAAGLVVAAASLLFIVVERRILPQVPGMPELTSLEEPSIRASQSEPLENAPPVEPPRPAHVVASNADFTRDQSGERDMVVLRDGELAIDALERAPITVIAGDTHVTLASSRAKLVAHHGVIVTAYVFAGRAEVTRAGEKMVIVAGDVWNREAATVAPAPPAEAPAPTSSMAAFRTGWEQLRAQHYAEAIAAFDRATDEVVAEDAAFWAAIASERAGNRDAAAKRLRTFIARYPSSPRLDAARGALDRVTR